MTYNEVETYCSVELLYKGNNEMHLAQSVF